MGGFVRDWQTKSLDDYLALFRRCVVLDVCLAIAYVASAASAYSARIRTGGALGTLGIISIGLVAAIALLWLLDAVLLCKLRSSATAAAGDREALARLLWPASICVASSGIGLFVYLTHVGVDLLANVGSSVSIGGAVSVLLVIIVLQKGLRLLAVHSFGAWLRAQTKVETGAEQHS